MKKFLTATSLLLVAMMLFSVIPASAETIDPWEAPEGIQTYYANELTAAPTIDGEIAEGEYGDLTVRMTPDMRLTFSAESTGQQDSAIDTDRAAQPASDYIDFYFAYDADYIYIAMEDMGGSWEEGSETYEFIQNLLGDGVEVGNYAARNNYHFHTGFFLDDCTSFLSMQASSRGFDENKWFDQGSAMNGNADPVYGQPNAFCDAVYIKKTNLATGEVFADAPTGYLNESNEVRGNVNLVGAQYKAVIEIRYSKDKLLNLMNDLYSFDFVELPNAMWFWFTGRTYAANSTTAHGGDVTGYNRYFATDIREDDTDYSDYGIAEGSSANTIPGLIVFGDENTVVYPGLCEGEEYPAVEPDVTEPAGDADVTEPAATEPAATEPATTEPATTEPATTEPATTEAADDEEETTKKTETTKAPETTAAVEEKGGCGSSVSVAGIALVAALGTCTVFVAKKKED